MSFKDIKNREFYKTVSNKLTLGSSKSTFWFKLNFTNPTGSDLTRFLELTENFIDRVDLYEVHSDGTVSISKNGLSIPFVEKIKIIFRHLD